MHKWKQLLTFSKVIDLKLSLSNKLIKDNHTLNYLKGVSRNGNL